MPVNEMIFLGSTYGAWPTSPPDVSTNRERLRRMGSRWSAGFYGWAKLITTNRRQ